MVMNLAHRGASQYAPENTLAAFYKGLELGATGLETDLRRSRDGVIFLLHDAQLDRTTNGKGNPSNYDWKELSELDAGSWFSPLYAGERLVSLETFIHVFGRKPVQLALELKEPGLEQETLETVLSHGLLDKVTLTSFHYDILREIRLQHESVRLGYLVQEWDADVLARMQEIRVQQLCPLAEALTADQVRVLQQQGFEVRAWKVRNEELMFHCLRCGVDGMTINFPDKLFQATQGVV
jgi:glycerophosphoryl diester phosphodiesterase